MKVMLNKYPTRYLLMAMIYILVLTTDSDEATTSELPAYLQHDKACGPRCLLALIKIENQFMSHYDVNNIYQIIGKKPFSPTTLKDLKIGAQKLGFSAVGYKLKLNDLKKLNSYAILPIGRSEGTASDPLHFILINGVNDNFVSIVDTETFILHDFPLNKLEKLWGGYALALSLQENVTLPSKNNKSQSAKEESDTKYDGIKDFDIVDSGSMLQHSFVIRNETGRRCRLRIVSRSCSCISPEFGKTELEPNEETTLKLKLHVNKPGMSIVKVSLSLDPEGIIKTYVLKALGRDTFYTEPEIGNVEAPDGGIVEYPVKVVYFIDSNNAVTFDHIESNIPNISVGNTTAKKTEKGEYSAFLFNVTLIYDGGKPTDALSKYQDELKFVLNTTKGKRYIPFKLSVKSGKPKYRLSPEKVFIIASKSSTPIEKKVKVEFLTEAVLKNISIKSDVALPLEIRTTQTSKNAYIISMSAGPETLQDTPLGMTKGEIIIVPEGTQSSTQITLPISLFVRE